MASMTTRDLMKLYVDDILKKSDRDDSLHLQLLNSAFFSAAFSWALLKTACSKTQKVCLAKAVRMAQAISLKIGVHKIS